MSRSEDRIVNDLGRLGFAVDKVRRGRKKTTLIVSKKEISMDNNKETGQPEEEKRTFVGAHIRSSIAIAVKLAAIKDGVTQQTWIENVLSREVEARGSLLS